MRRWCAAIWVFVTSVVVVHAATGSSGALRGSRIVILNGLPGDAESDRDYQRQLGATLDLLSAAGVDPAAVHILVNDPVHSAIVPAWKGADIQPANRANFLTLGKSLGASSGPVIAIVWGHGGMLRDTPVLHVAGPRITREDFLTFAHDVEKSGASTRWAFFFTGSGAVARALAAEPREILASENAVLFTSDPLGLDIFLTAWKRDPDASLGDVARAAGPQIAKWYEDRSQARTEEPTWFAGAAAPVLLAELKPPETKASPTPVARELPESWKEIHPVKAADYPGSEAVVLSRDTRYALGENPAVVADIDEYTQILTPEGKRAGDFDLEFSPPDEDLEFVSLEVLGAGGKLIPFDPDQVHDSKRSSMPGYETGQRKIFSLPGVEPGAILHVKYRRVWKRFPFPHVFLELPIADEVPVLRSSLRVETLRGQVLHHAIADGPGQSPRESETSYGRAYEWSWSNLPAQRDELLAAPGVEPRVLLSTFPDWKAFADWYGRLIREADTVTDEIRAKSAELTIGLKTPREKTKAVFEYVTRLRYVSIPLGVNSFRPHAAANVLRDQYGDCKDKANLLNTLLRAAGVEANLVLVPRFGQTNRAVPGLAFNHAISRVDLPDGPIWVDSTDDVCPFGMLPPGDPGREVLVIDGKSEDLRRLPDPDPDAHGFDIEFDVTADGKTDAKLSGRGYAGYRMREAARHADKYNGTISFLMANEFTPINGTFVSTTETHPPVSELEGAFDWKAVGTWTGLTTMVPGDGGRLILGPFVLPSEWLHAMQPRTQPLLLNDGFPVTIRQIARFDVSPGKIDLPAPSEEADGPLRWHLTWKQEAGAAIADLHVSLPRSSLDREQAGLFQKQLLRLCEALRVPVLLGLKE